MAEIKSSGSFILFRWADRQFWRHSMKFRIFLMVAMVAMVTFLATGTALATTETAATSVDVEQVAETARPGVAVMFCTQVQKTGTCDTYQGQVYCNTTGGVGTLSCPTGYHHVSSSSTPNPCLPLGGACTRTINCCLDQDTDVEPLSALSANPSMKSCSGQAAQAVR
jgi:hypothetical protein